MVERKLDGTVDESSADRKFVNWTRLYITCEKSGGLHLAEPGLTAGWLAVCPADEIWVRVEILKACCSFRFF